jgi:cyanate permease
MQRIWAVVLSVWAMLAIVAVLAWTHYPAAPVTSPSAAQTYVTKIVNGKKQLVLVQPGALGATHATTSTSGVVR